MKIETGFAISFLIAVFLQFTNTIGGNILMVLVLSLLLIFYLLGAFYLFAYKKIKHQNLALSITAGIFLTAPITGILYKLMYWPGSKMMITYGWVISLIFVVLSLFLKRKSTEELKKYYKNMLIRSSVLFILTLTLSFIPSQSLIKFKYRNDPEMARLRIQVMENPRSIEYRLELDEYMMSKDIANKKK